MTEFLKVTDLSGIEAVAKLAHEIWNQHFVSIIGQPQVDYMLDTFQSFPALSRQIEEGFEYFILADDGINVGYLGLLSDHEEGRMMISKLYIRQPCRGTGVGNRALDFVRELSNVRHIDTIWLTVNRYNQATIDWYRRKGFTVVDEVNKDIGNGFFMDDYIMELKVV